jgi:hypothetical protein
MLRREIARSSRGAAQLNAARARTAGRHAGAAQPNLTPIGLTRRTAWLGRRGVARNNVPPPTPRETAARRRSDVLRLWSSLVPPPDRMTALRPERRSLLRPSLHTDEVPAARSSTRPGGGGVDDRVARHYRARDEVGRERYRRRRGRGRWRRRACVRLCARRVAAWWPRELRTHAVRLALAGRARQREGETCGRIAASLGRSRVKTKGLRGRRARSSDEPKSGCGLGPSRPHVSRPARSRAAGRWTARRHHRRHRNERHAPFTPEDDVDARSSSPAKTALQLTQRRAQMRRSLFGRKGQRCH